MRRAFFDCSRAFLAIFFVMVEGVVVAISRLGVVAWLNCCVVAGR